MTRARVHDGMTTWQNGLHDPEGILSSGRGLPALSGPAQVHGG